MNNRRLLRELTHLYMHIFVTIYIYIYIYVKAIPPPPIPSEVRGDKVTEAPNAKWDRMLIKDRNIGVMFMNKTLSFVTRKGHEHRL